MDSFNNNRINYLILFIISIVTLNYQDHSIYGGLDGSYFWAFNYILSHQPQDLDKITNIYGPLAFLHNPVHYGYLIIIGTLFQILVKFTYGYAMPRLIGLSRALDLVLTGRPVGAQEALAMGLANRVVPKGEARAHAEELAATIASFPVACMRNDRLSLHEQHDLPIAEALQNELRHGLRSLEAGDALALAAAFSEGQLGRHGSFEVPPSPRKGSS